MAAASLKAAVLGLSISVLASCAVIRGQESAREYASDTAITTDIKARMASDKTVSATSIGVETLEGTVQLSGFARSQAERERAAELARGVRGVRSVQNNIVVRP